MKKFAMMTMLALSTACGSGYQIDDGNLAGTVDGSSWALNSGITDSFLSDEESYSVNLYGGADAITCDGYSDNEAPMVMLSVPKKPGEYELKLELFADDNLTVTVVTSAGENVILTEGILSVESVTADVVRAGLYATDTTGGYELSGHFEVPICN